MLFRVLIFALCYCLCVADDNVTETEMPENNVTVTYDYDSKQLTTYVQSDNITLNCSLSLPDVSHKNRHFLKFFKSGKIIQKPIVLKLLNIARHFISVKCSRKHNITDEKNDERENFDTLPINTDIDDPNINERMGKAINFNRNRNKRPPYQNTKPTMGIRPTPKATTVKPRQITTTIKPRPVTGSKPKGTATKQPSTPKSNSTSKVQKPVISTNVNNSKSPNKVVSTTTYNTSKTPTSTKGRNSTVVNTTLIPIKLNRTETTTEILKKDTTAALETEKYLNWYTLTAVGGGVVAFLLCLACVIHGIKKRRCTGKTGAYDSKRKCEFSPIGDQTTIYSIPYGFANPRSTDSPLNTGLRSESNGEIHYAVLDISPTANMQKRIVVEESAYAEVIPDASGHLYPITHQLK